MEVLKVLQAFEDESDYTVWSAVHNCVARLNQLLSHTDFHSSFAAFVRHLFCKISQHLGWEAKPGESKYMSLYLLIGIFTLIYRKSTPVLILVIIPVYMNPILGGIKAGGK